ncbi:Acg family FMN-binding oxidoreductase [Rhodovulum steppense]|uniref:Nitroreductase family protein n=1 Tax=Rhodovulum steppense TaxID=540251 RepID=A0A4R1YLR9_9RHOB|nr:nitroreductase family protein [Rhodovulum steppense]TCM78083.1 nitroreductase family protein [Rhodovulum steppense]
MTMGRRGLLTGGGVVLASLGAAGWLGWRGMGSSAEMAALVTRQRQTLPLPASSRDLIRYATLAANGHNTQPWLFRPDARGIDILPDVTRRTPVVDPDDHHFFASLGCAAENLALAAGARGKSGEIGFDPEGGGRVRVDLGTAQGGDAALFEAIPLRQSTRSDYDGSAVSAADLSQLAMSAAVPGVDLILISERAQIDQLRDLVIAGNTAQMADPAFVTELMHWLRFNPAAAMTTGDGLYSVASGNPALPDWLGPRLFDMVFTAQAENEKYARQIASSSGVAVFVAAQANPEHWVQAGRACQRFSLQATALGLKTAYINQPVEVPGLRADLAALVGLPGRRPDIVMRFGRAPAMPMSARRPVEAVMV